MKDSELRGVVLKAFYARRRENELSLITLTEKDLPGVTRGEAISISTQLADKGLLDKWRPNRSGSGPDFGTGKISAGGIDVVEGSVRSPVAIVIDQSQKVTITGSSNVGLSNSPTINIHLALSMLAQRIDQSASPDAEKQEAKSRLKTFLEHPVVAAIIGGLAGSI